MRAFFALVVAAVAVSSNANAWPEGAADDRNVGSISGRVGLGYTMLAPSTFTLSESSGITSETISPSGVIHGFDFFGGMVLPRFQAEVWLGMSFGTDRTVDAVTLGSDYDGAAYAGGHLPGANLFVLRSKLLFGPRVPLGSFALSAGPGIGAEMWLVSPHDGGKESRGELVASERMNQGMMTVPLYAQGAWKPTCGMVTTMTFVETLGVTGAKFSYPGLSLGFGFEDCEGTDVAMHLAWRRDAGGQPADFARDRYACVKENTITINAAVGDTSTVDQVGTNRTDWNMVDMCLQARGWRQVWEPVGPAPGSN